MKHRALSYILAAAIMLPMFIALPLEASANPSAPVSFSGTDTNWVKAFNVDNAYIDLGDETIMLPAGFTVAAYSINGGQKWIKSGLPSEDELKKLLNSGLTLWIASAFNSDNKAPEAGATVIRFPAIKARPKRNPEKLKPFYSDTHWVLARNGETIAVFSGYEYAPTSNGKTPDEPWAPVDAEGFEIISGKAKSTLLIRVAPDANNLTPAGVSWRVKPANFSRAPKYRFKLVKDPANKGERISVLNLRKGDQYKFGRGLYNPALEQKRMFMTEELSKEGSDIRIRKAATGKKPPSEMQTLWLSAVSNLPFRGIGISPAPVVGNPVYPKPANTASHIVSYDYKINKWDWVNDIDGITPITAYHFNGPFFLQVELEALEDYTFEGITEGKLESILKPLFPGCTNILDNGTDWVPTIRTVAADADGKYTLKFTIRYNLNIIIENLTALTATASRPTGTFLTNAVNYFDITNPPLLSVANHGSTCWADDTTNVYTFIAQIKLTAAGGYRFDEDYKSQYLGRVLADDYKILEIEVAEHELIVSIGYTHP